jgi:ATP-binding cassette, subfamily B (MDR/TAP), member 1
MIYTSIWVLFSAVMGAGVSMSNVPSVGKAKASANSIFAIIDEKSTLDVRVSNKAPKQDVKEGSIEFRDVSFKYPSRSTQVLDEMNFEIPATTKIALVGASGCGKSTITNLLLRFYDIENGNILIDGVDIKDYNIKKLRQEIGYVMQEPILFNQSIKDNILYGY